MSRHNRIKHQECTGIVRASSQPVAVVAQQMSDLLLAFPAAASSGVRWHELVRKYQERYKIELDIGALGHSTPLTAATTLLWDVLRIVDQTDPLDPVVGVEDNVALTPRAGLLGCWPSLYRALCDIVQEEGSLTDSAEGHSLLLSQIRPLLEHYWLANFDESGLGFLNAEGGFIRLKKLKHLLQWLLKWREERLGWRRSNVSRKPSALDKILEPTLRLVPSEKYNDLLLILTVGETVTPLPMTMTNSQSLVDAHSLEDGGSQTQSIESSIDDTVPNERMDLTIAPQDASQATSLEEKKPAAAILASVSNDVPSQNEIDEMRRELESLRSESHELDRLRSENRNLWVENTALHFGTSHQTMSSSPMFPQSHLPIVDLPAQVFDDPFEPPPEARTWCSYSNVSRTTSVTDIGTVDVSSEFSMGSSSMVGTPRFFGMSAHSTCGSEVQSGAMTPLGNCQPQQPVGAFVPVWFLGGMDFSVIPRGIVETARAHFERLGSK